MSGKGVRDILKGVDLLGFGRHAADRTETDQDRGMRAVTAKVGKDLGPVAISSAVGRARVKVQSPRT